MAVGDPERGLEHAKRALQIAEATQTSASTRGEAHFVLAKARWAAGLRIEGRASLDAAKRVWAEADPPEAANIELADAWLEDAASGG